MRVFYGSEAYIQPSPGPVVTVGNFDGVHRGHQALLSRLRDVAAGRPTLVYTFDPAPVAVLAPEKHQPRIQTLDERVATLLHYVDHVVIEPFTLDYARHDAEWFATEVLGRRLGATGMVVGWDFRFGRGRAGNAADLAKWLPVDSYGPWTDGEQVFSSSQIRKLVTAGDVVTAATLLGRPPRITGDVVHGDGRGRTIGVPTANVDVLTELLPADGVYAVRLQHGDNVYPGVMNLGTRPTFDAGRSCEVHVLDRELDLYGARVGVDVIQKIRDVQRFSGVEALVAQIRADIHSARQLL